MDDDREIPVDTDRLLKRIDRYGVARAAMVRWKYTETDGKNCKIIIEFVIRHALR